MVNNQRHKMSVWFIFSHSHYTSHGRAKFEVQNKGEVYFWSSWIGTVEIKTVTKIKI